MKQFFHYRYNVVDMISVAAATGLIARTEIIGGIIALVIGLIVSVIGQMYFGTKGEGK